MKQSYKYIEKIAIAILLTTLTLSCKNSFLEITPKGRLIAQTVSDYDLLLSNLQMINIGANAHVAMSDEVASIEPYFTGSDLKTKRLFRWEDVVYDPEENPNEFNSFVQNIYVFNKIINEIPNATEGTEQEKQSVQAEAMAGRAWSYFQLINFFGKPYNTSTSDTDLGFPIITQSDVTETVFTRATVKEVYNFILSDLTAAIPNLPQKTTHRTRMSKVAGQALLGKVLVFMGRFEEALPYFNESLAHLSNSAIPLRLYDYNETFAPGGAFLPISSYGPNYPNVANIEENIYGKHAYTRWTGSSNEIIIDKKTVELFQPSDLRLNFYSDHAQYGSQYPAGFLRKTGPSNVQIGMLIPDIYLLRAECKVRTNDLSGAVADVETLRKNRMPLTDSKIPSLIAEDQLSLLNFVLEERIREFAVSGTRWFDMRRLSVDPLFENSTYTHILYSENGEIKETFTLKPDRFVLRFPQKVIDENPGMQNNP